MQTIIRNDKQYFYDEFMIDDDSSFFALAEEKVISVERDHIRLIRLIEYPDIGHGNVIMVYNGYKLYKRVYSGVRMELDDMIEYLEEMIKEIRAK